MSDQNPSPPATVSGVPSSIALATGQIIDLSFIPEAQRNALMAEYMRRVGKWRGGVRSGMSVSPSFVWRCLSGSTIAPFPLPSHR